MRLFDTAKRQHVTFDPGKVVRLYVCGITPYDAAHLGHIFTFMTYDLLQRRLESLGHEVRLVRNITDVDEPIFRKADELGIPYTELAEQESAALHQVLARLNFRTLYAEPKASGYIPQMAEAVRELVSRGYGYHVDDDVYFDTTALASFGSFSGFHDHLKAGLMAARGGDPDRPGKRAPLDFLLWKAVRDPSDSAAWESPLGRGRPGWHIECTVMSEATLGTPFDLHGGGNDLIFPHHECEVAQSTALGQAKPATTWLHTAALLMDGEKMSKSLGNLVFARDVLDSYEPAVLRLALMHYHYHTGGEWRSCTLQEAAVLLHGLHHAALVAGDVAADRLYAEVCDALDNDLDTPHIVHLFRHFAEDHSTPAGSGAVPHPAVMRTLSLLGLT